MANNIGLWITIGVASLLLIVALAGAFTRPKFRSLFRSKNAQNSGAGSRRNSDTSAGSRRQSLVSNADDMTLYKRELDLRNEYAVQRGRVTDNDMEYTLLYRETRLMRHAAVKQHGYDARLKSMVDLKADSKQAQAAMKTLRKQFNDQNLELMHGRDINRETYDLGNRING